MKRRRKTFPIIATFDEGEPPCIPERQTFDVGDANMYSFEVNKSGPVSRFNLHCTKVELNVWKAFDKRAVDAILFRLTG